MKILILGSGGREHALGWKILQSPHCTQLFFAPGNGGTSNIGTNISDLRIEDGNQVTDWVLQNGIELVIIGPEAPLVSGVADRLRAAGILTVGPGSKGSQIESSKIFAKAFMIRNKIPTARYRHYYDVEQSIADLANYSLPIVVKADGLAAGKGVIIAQTYEEAMQAIYQMGRDHKFGTAGKQWLVEEFMQGIELSVFVLTDGKDYVILPTAKDYKRIGEGDTGPNTGGMGSVAPVPFADESFMEKVRQKVIEPTLNGLQKEGIEYQGFIFFGLMNVNGEPKVLEYNARMGDPETQSVMPLIASDLVELLIDCAKGQLSGKSISISSDVAVTIIVASGGYPDEYNKGYEIRALDQVMEVITFHAGTQLKDDAYFTSGGRVVGFTGIGKDVTEARNKALQAAQTICYENIYYRKDIGNDLLS